MYQIYRKNDQSRAEAIYFTNGTGKTHMVLKFNTEDLFSDEQERIAQLLVKTLNGEQENDSPETLSVSLTREQIMDEVRTMRDLVQDNKRFLSGSAVILRKANGRLIELLDLLNQFEITPKTK